jgi:hypothetical protein
MQTKEFGDFILARPADSNAQREFDQPLLVVVDFDLVHREEHDSRCRAGAFVAIDERMVLHEVVQVRCSHFKRKRMQVVASKRRLRLRYSLMKQVGIARSLNSTVVLDQPALA